MGNFWTVVGSLGGVVLGFILSELKRWLKTRKNKKDSQRITRYILNSQLNMHKQLRDFINRENQNRINLEVWQRIREFNMGFQLPSIDFSKIAFLINGDEALLNRFLTADSAYQQVFNLVKMRNEIFQIYEEKTQNISEESIDEITSILGPRIIGKLGYYTREVSIQNQRAIEDHEKALENKNFWYKLTFLITRCQVWILNKTMCHK